MIIGNKIDMDTNKGIVNFGISTNWNVITGGPSSGKTTIVNQLKKLGFSSTPEAARVLIDIGINNGLTIQEIRRDEEQFNQSILCIQMAMENILVPDHVCFHDRGTPDSLAYIRLSGGDESIARKFAMKRKYNKIFGGDGWLHEKQSKLADYGFIQYKSGIQRAPDGSDQVAMYYKKQEKKK